jgi:hypothetical protein
LIHSLVSKVDLMEIYLYAYFYNTFTKDSRNNPG